jgi:methionyl-tRNA formyltransferase
MLLQEAIPIGPRATVPELHDALAALGGHLILRALAENPAAVPQPGGATYAGKLTREDGRLDWRRSAEDLDRQVRALTPWPGAWTTIDAQVLKILEAMPADSPPAPPGTVLQWDGMRGFWVACGRGALRLLRVQVAGRAPQEAAAFLRGWRSLPARLGLS